MASARPFIVAPGGLNDQHEEDAEDLQGVGPSTQEQDAEASGQGETQEGSPGSCRAE